VQLRDRNTQITTLHGQHEEQLANLHSQLSDESEFFKIEKETNENELKGKLASTMKDNAVLFQRLADAMRKHGEAVKQKEASEKAMKEIETTMEEKNKSKEEERLKIDGVKDGRISKLEEEISDLRASHDATSNSLSQEVEKYQKAAQNAEFDLENCQEDVDTMQEQVMFLRRTNDEYEEEIEKLEGRLLELGEGEESDGNDSDSSEELLDNDNDREFGTEIGNRKKSSHQNAKNNRFKRGNKREGREYVEA